MKVLSALALLLALASRPLFAQDLLTKRTGEEIYVKVLEINPTEVKYRRADNPDGPLITAWKSDIFQIRYANGVKEMLTNVPPAANPSLVSPPAPVVATPLSANPSLATPPPATHSSTAPLSTAPLATPSPANVNSVIVPGDEIENNQPVSLDGPRLGFTVLTGGVIDKAREQISDLNPFLTQFGWQFEGRLFRMPNGISGLVEFVPLVGGLEQSHFIPSLSGLLGIRGPKGFEVGMGPNITPLGTNVVFAIGTSYRSNGINFPINLAVVPGNGGARISLVFGFNARHH